MNSSQSLLFPHKWNPELFRKTCPIIYRLFKRESIKGVWMEDVEKLIQLLTIIETTSLKDQKSIKHLFNTCPNTNHSDTSTIKAHAQMKFKKWVENQITSNCPKNKEYRIRHITCINYTKEWTLPKTRAIRAVDLQDKYYNNSNILQKSWWDGPADCPPIKNDIYLL